MNQFKVTRSEFVEINVGATSVNQTIYFPDLPNLRNTKTYGLSAYDKGTLSYGLQGQVVDYQKARQLLVYLYFDNGLFVVQPYTSFMNNFLDYTNGANGYFNVPVNLAGQRITWSKSYVQITNTTDIPNYANLSFVFNVYYTLN